MREHVQVVQPEYEHGLTSRDGKEIDSVGMNWILFSKEGFAKVLIDILIQRERVVYVRMRDVPKETSKI